MVDCFNPFYLLISLLAFTSDLFFTLSYLFTLSKIRVEVYEMFFHPKSYQFFRFQFKVKVYASEIKLQLLSTLTSFFTISFSTDYYNN